MNLTTKKTRYSPQRRCVQNLELPVTVPCLATNVAAQEGHACRDLNGIEAVNGLLGVFVNLKMLARASSCKVLIILLDQAAARAIPMGIRIVITSE